MTVSDVLRYYRTQTAVAEALNMKQNSVAGWVKRQKVPLLRQLQLERATRGKLKADKNLLFN